MAKPKKRKDTGTSLIRTTGRCLPEANDDVRYTKGYATYRTGTCIPVGLLHTVSGVLLAILVPAELVAYTPQSDSSPTQIN